MWSLKRRLMVVGAAVLLGVVILCAVIFSVLLGPEDTWRSLGETCTPEWVISGRSDRKRCCYPLVCHVDNTLVSSFSSSSYSSFGICIPPFSLPLNAPCDVMGDSFGALCQIGLACVPPTTNELDKEVQDRIAFNELNKLDGSSGLILDSLPSSSSFKAGLGPQQTGVCQRVHPVGYPCDPRAPESCASRTCRLVEVQVSSPFVNEDTRSALSKKSQDVRKDVPILPDKYQEEIGYKLMDFEDHRITTTRFSDPIYIAPRSDVPPSLLQELDSQKTSRLLADVNSHHHRFLQATSGYSTPLTTFSPVFSSDSVRGFFCVEEGLGEGSRCDSPFRFCQSSCSECVSGLCRDITRTTALESTSPLQQLSAMLANKKVVTDKYGIAFEQTCFDTCCGQYSYCPFPPTRYCQPRKPPGSSCISTYSAEHMPSYKLASFFSTTLPSSFALSYLRSIQRPHPIDMGECEPGSICLAGRCREKWSEGEGTKAARSAGVELVCKPWLKYENGECRLVQGSRCSTDAECWGVASPFGYCDSTTDRCVTPSFDMCLPHFKKLLGELTQPQPYYNTRQVSMVSEEFETGSPLPSMLNLILSVMYAGESPLLPGPSLYSHKAHNAANAFLCCVRHEGDRQNYQGGPAKSLIDRMKKALRDGVNGSRWEGEELRRLGVMVDFESVLKMSSAYACGGQPDEVVKSVGGLPFLNCMRYLASEDLWISREMASRTAVPSNMTNLGAAKLEMSEATGAGMAGSQPLAEPEGQEAEATDAPSSELNFTEKIPSWGEANHVISEMQNGEAEETASGKLGVSLAQIRDLEIGGDNGGKLKEKLRLVKRVFTDVLSLITGDTTGQYIRVGEPYVEGRADNMAPDALDRLKVVVPFNVQGVNAVNPQAVVQELELQASTPDSMLNKYLDGYGLSSTPSSLTPASATMAFNMPYFKLLNRTEDGEVFSDVFRKAVSNVLRLPKGKVVFRDMFPLPGKSLVNFEVLPFHRVPSVVVENARMGTPSSPAAAVALLRSNLENKTSPLYSGSLGPYLVQGGEVLRHLPLLNLEGFSSEPETSTPPLGSPRSADISEESTIGSSETRDSVEPNEGATSEGTTSENTSNDVTPSSIGTSDSNSDTPNMRDVVENLDLIPYLSEETIYDMTGTERLGSLPLVDLDHPESQQVALQRSAGVNLANLLHELFRSGAAMRGSDIDAAISAYEAAAAAGTQSGPQLLLTGQNGAASSDGGLKATLFLYPGQLNGEELGFEQQSLEVIRAQRTVRDRQLGLARVRNSAPALRGLQVAARPTSMALATDSSLLGLDLMNSEETIFRVFDMVRSATRPSVLVGLCVRLLPRRLGRILLRLWRAVLNRDIRNLFSMAQQGAPSSNLHWRWGGNPQNWLTVRDFASFTPTLSAVYFSVDPPASPSPDSQDAVEGDTGSKGFVDTFYEDRRNAANGLLSYITDMVQKPGSPLYETPSMKGLGPSDVSIVPGWRVWDPLASDVQGGSEVPDYFSPMSSSNLALSDFELTEAEFDGKTSSEEAAQSSLAAQQGETPSNLSRIDSLTEDNNIEVNETATTASSENRNPDATDTPMPTEPHSSLLVDGLPAATGQSGSEGEPASDDKRLVLRMVVPEAVAAALTQSGLSPAEALEGQIRAADSEGELKSVTVTDVKGTSWKPGNVSQLVTEVALEIEADAGGRGSNRFVGNATKEELVSAEKAFEMLQAYLESDGAYLANATGPIGQIYSKGIADIGPVQLEGQENKNSSALNLIISSTPTGSGDLLSQDIDNFRRAFRGALPAIASRVGLAPSQVRLDAVDFVEDAVLANISFVSAEDDRGAKDEQYPPILINTTIAEAYERLTDNLTRPTGRFYIADSSISAIFSSGRGEISSFQILDADIIPETNNITTVDLLIRTPPLKDRAVLSNVSEADLLSVLSSIAESVMGVDPSFVDVSDLEDEADSRISVKLRLAIPLEYSHEQSLATTEVSTAAALARLEAALLDGEGALYSKHAPTVGAYNRTHTPKLVNVLAGPGEAVEVRLESAPFTQAAALNSSLLEGLTDDLIAVTSTLAGIEPGRVDVLSFSTSEENSTVVAVIKINELPSTESLEADLHEELAKSVQRLESAVRDPTSLFYSHDIDLATIYLPGPAQVEVSPSGPAIPPDLLDGRVVELLNKQSVAVSVVVESAPIVDTSRLAELSVSDFSKIFAAKVANVTAVEPNRVQIHAVTANKNKQLVVRLDILPRNPMGQSTIGSTPTAFETLQKLSGSLRDQDGPFYDKEDPIGALFSFGQANILEFYDVGSVTAAIVSSPLTDFSQLEDVSVGEYSQQLRDVVSKLTGVSKGRISVESISPNELSQLVAVLRIKSLQRDTPTSEPSVHLSMDMLEKALADQDSLWYRNDLPMSQVYSTGPASMQDLYSEARQGFSTPSYVSVVLRSEALSNPSVLADFSVESYKTRLVDVIGTAADLDPKWVHIGAVTSNEQQQLVTEVQFYPLSSTDDVPDFVSIDQAVENLHKRLAEPNSLDDVMDYPTGRIFAAGPASLSALPYTRSTAVQASLISSEPIQSDVVLEGEVLNRLKAQFVVLASKSMGIPPPKLHVDWIKRGDRDRLVTRFTVLPVSVEDVKPVSVPVSVGEALQRLRDDFSSDDNSLWSSPLGVLFDHGPVSLSRLVSVNDSNAGQSLSEGNVLRISVLSPLLNETAQLANLSIGEFKKGFVSTVAGILEIPKGHISVVSLNRKDDNRLVTTVVVDMSAQLTEIPKRPSSILEAFTALEEDVASPNGVVYNTEPSISRWFPFGSVDVIRVRSDKSENDVRNAAAIATITSPVIEDSEAIAALSIEEYKNQMVDVVAQIAGIPKSRVQIVSVEANEDKQLLTTARISPPSEVEQKPAASNAEYVHKKREHSDIIKKLEMLLRDPSSGLYKEAEGAVLTSPSQILTIYMKDTGQPERDEDASGITEDILSNNITAVIINASAHQAPDESPDQAESKTEEPTGDSASAEVPVTAGDNTTVALTNTSAMTARDPEPVEQGSVGLDSVDLKEDIEQPPTDEADEGQSEAVPIAIGEVPRETAGESPINDGNVIVGSAVVEEPSGEEVSGTVGDTLNTQDELLSIEDSSADVAVAGGTNQDVISDIHRDEDVIISFMEVASKVATGTVHGAQEGSQAEREDSEQVSSRNDSKEELVSATQHIEPPDKDPGNAFNKAISGSGVPRDENLSNGVTQSTTVSDDSAGPQAMSAHDALCLLEVDLDNPYGSFYANNQYLGDIYCDGPATVTRSYEAASEQDQFNFLQLQGGGISFTLTSSPIEDVSKLDKITKDHYITDLVQIVANISRIDPSRLNVHSLGLSQHNELIARLTISDNFREPVKADARAGQTKNVLQGSGVAVTGTQSSVLVDDSPSSSSVASSEEQLTSRDRDVDKSKEETDDTSIWDVIQQRPELKEYARLVSLSCEGPTSGEDDACLIDVLKGLEPSTPSVTVVAFSRLAITSLKDDVYEALKKTENRSILRQILAHSVLVGRHPIYTLNSKTNNKYVRNLAGSVIRFRYFNIRGPSLLQVDKVYTQTRVVDIEAGNGYIHVARSIPIPSGIRLPIILRAPAETDGRVKAPGNSAFIPLRQDCRLVRFEPIVSIQDATGKHLMAWPPNAVCYFLSSSRLRRDYATSTELEGETFKYKALQSRGRDFSHNAHKWNGWQHR